MKILCLSDTHGLHNKIPKEWLIPADVLVHSRDETNMGRFHEIKKFLEWFDSLDKIFFAQSIKDKYSEEEIINKINLNI